MFPTATPTLPPADQTTGRRLGDVKKVAAKCDCSTRHIYRRVDLGAMPAPRRIGRLVRWDMDEIDRWIADGCPNVRNMTKGGRA